ncbi:MAG: hypothetical protein Q9183_004009 [Haloplaca sp. 2 TL-2023]
MASQWPYNYQVPQGNGYDQYAQEYQHSASEQYGQSMPPQYGQQAPQQYGQPTTQPYEQQQQQYPQQYSQQFPQQSPQQYPQQYHNQYPNQPPHHYPQPYYQQPASQYPQQSLPQHYPVHQYPAHQPGQYPAQQPGQYPAQQSGQYPQPFGQYPSPHPTASTPAYPSQPQPQPGQQTCYNCGATGHWAQDCPEPRRETPAGSYGRPPPPKRQKPNPPVVTKYPVPSHVQPYHGQPGQAYGTPYLQSNHPQYQAPPGPPTPMSGQSPANQQWPQQQYSQQYQQPYPQHQQYSQSHQQAGYQPQQSAIPTAPPTPSTPHSVHHSPQVPAQASQANKAGFFPTASMYQQSPNAVQHLSSASPHSTGNSTALHAQNHHSQPAASATSSTHSSRRSSVSMRSMSLTPKPQAVEDGDDGDEDFRQLDIPDIPPTSIGNVEYPPPRLVDRSLPTNFIVADALDPFDPPLPENNGYCRSKYTAQDGSSTFLNSIRDTRHWQEFKSDPIFASVHTNRQVIPLDAILSTYQSSYEDADYGQAEEEREEWSGDARPSVGREEAKEVTNRLDHSVRAEEPASNAATVPYTVSRDHKIQSGSSNHGRLNGPADGARPPWGLPPRPEFSAYGKRDRPDEETTASQWPAKLARIGRIVNRTCPPPPAMPESPTDSPGVVASPPRSRTPSMFELNEYSQQDMASGNAFDTAFTRNGMQGNSHAGLPDPFEPPPPPPSARLHRPASFDGPGERPSTAGSPNGCLNGDGVHGSQSSNGNGRSYSQDHVNSPSRLRSEMDGRKRESDQPDLSDDDNTPKRRQMDDTKSKLRKRQPTVAAAYR